MSWIGDFKLGNTFDTKFTTRQISGAPSTLGSSPVISCYVGNGTTEITAGITLSVDFDGRTGLNNIRVVATSGNGYATATDNQLVITTGTVNSVSVVGEVVAEFAIENRRSDVQFWNGTAVSSPATAGIPDVNVKNYNNAAVATAASGIPKVDVDTIKTNAVVNGGTITFPTNATVASTTNITAGTITTTTNLTNLPSIPNNWLTAAGTAADFGTELATAIWTDTTAGDFTTVGSIGKSIMNGVALGTGLTVNDLTTKTGFALTAAYDPAKTAAQAGDAMTLTAGERTTTAGVIWATVMTGTTTAIQAVRGFIAALLGKASGLDANAPIYRDIADTKNVISATTDANGNRTSVTLDLT
jgi:hypothetical protein